MQDTLEEIKWKKIVTAGYVRSTATVMLLSQETQSP